MRKILLLFIIALQCVFAQVDDTPIMNYWSGGQLDLSMVYSSNNSGPGSGSALFGGVISPGVLNKSAAMFTNPAELVMLKKPHFVFDSRLQIQPKNLGIGNGDLISEETIADGTDDFLEDTTTFKFPAGNLRIDTKLGNLELKQSGGVGAFSIAFPFWDRYALGIGYANIMSMDMEFLVSNLSTHIVTEKQIGNNITPIDMIVSNTVTGRYGMHIDQISLSGAMNISEFGKQGMFYVGLAANYYIASHQFNLFYNSDGMMVISNSTEYYFNDPNDKAINFEGGEDNKLFVKSTGNYKGSGWGAKIGMVFRPGTDKGFWSNFTLSAVLDIVPELDLEDKNAYYEGYQPKFLQGRPLGEDEDQMDILIDSIDIARPNLTVPASNATTTLVEVKMPSSFTLGMDWNWGKHLFSFNYVKYMGELSYKYDTYKIGKTGASGIKMGLDFQFKDRFVGTNWLLLPVRILFLDIDGALMQIFASKTGYTNPHYRAGFGLITGDAIVEGISDAEQEKDLKDMLDMPIPTGFSMGRTYTIFNNIDVGVLVFGFPDMFMRFSIGYNF